MAIIVMLLHQQLESPAAGLCELTAPQLQALPNWGIAAGAAAQNANGPAKT